MTEEDAIDQKESKSKKEEAEEEEVRNLSKNTSL